MSNRLTNMLRRMVDPQGRLDSRFYSDHIAHLPEHQRGRAEEERRRLMMRGHWPT